MQKKKILLLILLGFGISMELVLALYLLNRSAARNPGVSRLSSQTTLVSTIAVNIKSADTGTTNQNNNSDAYPAPGEDLTSGFRPPLGMDQATAETTLTGPVTPTIQAPSGSYAGGNAGGSAGGSYPAPGQSGGSFDAGGSAPPADTAGTSYAHSLNNLDAAWLVGTPEGPAIPTPSLTPTGSAISPTAAGSPTTGSTATATSSIVLSGVKTATPGITRTATAVSVSTNTATPAPAPAETTTTSPGATATPVATATAVVTTTPVAAATTVATVTPATATSPSATATAAAQALVSAPAANPPQVDGQGSDPAWTAAQPLEIATAGGANQSAARVTLRSVYTKDHVYFLLTWADPAQSYLLSPWQKATGGAWQKLSGADTYAEDQLALFWSAAGGSFMTVPSGQTADLWQWRSVQNVGQVDDLYQDSAGTHADPSTGGGYRDNVTANGKAPADMPPGGGAKTGAPGYILDSAQEPLNNRLFKPGDRVPSVIIAPFTGDRGDITAAWQYTNGTWTLEIGRKLVTGSAHDVQFSDLAQTYYFALATFDNTLSNHATQAGAAAFRFQH